jgi:muramoyltetrapeptide carboxypeptidase
MSIPTLIPARPPALRAGARVALIAPAGPVTPERLELSIERSRSLGLEPIPFPGAVQQQGYLAGSDAQRLSDLQNALDDDAIDAVWALRGGFGTTRILRRLDLSRACARPKPFIGFSDNTAVHAVLARHGLVSFHGPHPGGEFPAPTEQAFKQVLFHSEPAGLLPLRASDPPPRTLMSGCAEGPLIGGNLAMLAALCGTFASIHARGRILFFEDVGEAPYRLDRMLVQLRDAGVLDGVRGLALGQFTETAQETDQVESVLREFAEFVGVPAVLGLPIGHVEHNWTLPLLVQARLDAGAATLTITEAAVRE